MTPSRTTRHKDQTMAQSGAWRFVMQSPIVYLVNASIRSLSHYLVSESALCFWCLCKCNRLSCLGRVPFDVLSQQQFTKYANGVFERTASTLEWNVKCLERCIIRRGELMWIVRRMKNRSTPWLWLAVIHQPNQTSFVVVARSYHITDEKGVSAA